MKPNELIQQVEHLMGRQPEGYMIRLMNDGLLDMASKKKEYTVSAVYGNTKENISKSIFCMV